MATLRAGEDTNVVSDAHHAQRFQAKVKGTHRAGSAHDRAAHARRQEETQSRQIPSAACRHSYKGNGIDTADTCPCYRGSGGSRRGRSTATASAERSVARTLRSEVYRWQGCHPVVIARWQAHNKLFGGRPSRVWRANRTSAPPV
ncbi:hypothetical protein [Bacteroides acidifaciens]|uniref:hypothetical protein n=1 Tax=Bacteroides acidifaciens TaxID=85831 RepID=UPI00272D2DC3|nr:hypothetical protein [Bacteroides acidifaciens]